MKTWYNEFDPYAARWLRNLQESGHLPGGRIDERSIADVGAKELEGIQQAHFFAGIGGWPLALRLAGWPDDREVWTGSCPCQPFSIAGKRAAEQDPRHLWPAWRPIIAERRPAVIFGEQVGGPLGRQWLTGVRSDLEALGYEVGAADLCAAGAGTKAEGRLDFEDGSFVWRPIIIGAPHIRQRLWWVAYADGGKPGDKYLQRGGEYRQQREDDRASSRMADSQTKRNNEYAQRQGREKTSQLGVRGASGGMDDSKNSDGRRSIGPKNSGGWAKEAGGPSAVGGVEDAERWRLGREIATHVENTVEKKSNPQPANSAWSDFELTPCRDGKARRIEPGSFPLAHGIPNRVGRLRAYGNAIVPQIAATFVRAFLEVTKS